MVTLPRDRFSGSWVVVDRGMRKVVLETYSARTAAAINTARYEVLTAHAYLCELNRRIKADGEAVV